MTTLWTAPKTNWVANDGIVYTDLNRIEGNISAIRDATYKHVRGFGYIVSNANPSYDGLITIYEGSCFSTNSVPISAGAFTKNLNTWALGSGVDKGGMASAVTPAAQTWYYIFVIFNPSTGDADFMFDDNPSGSNISSGSFTEKRFVGTFKTGAAGTHSSFYIMEMYSIGDQVFINPNYFDDHGLVLTNNYTINNLYYNKLLSPVGGLALPALNVLAKLNIIPNSVNFGLVSNYGGVMSVPGAFFSSGYPHGEYVYITSPINSDKNTVDVDIMVDSTGYIQVAMYEISGYIGTLEIRVRGFYYER